MSFRNNSNVSEFTPATIKREIKSEPITVDDMNIYFEENEHVRFKRKPDSSDIFEPLF